MNKTTSWYHYVCFMNPAGFVKPFWGEAAKHLYNLLFDAEYRRYYRLVVKYGGTPRYYQRDLRVNGWKLTVPDVASFFSAYKEIFVEKIYAFPSESGKPVILDCGANIGLSILYYKKKYPDSTVIAYEADPKIFIILQKNLLNNGLAGVELHNKAVWSSAATLDFSVEGADGGRINIGSDKNIVSVPAEGLADIMRNRCFDFIKIDIEGAETEVLKGCEDYIAAVPYIFVEFHSFHNKKQELGRLIDTFERRGFRVHVHPPFTQKSPFLGVQANDGMDMQLNLFFWKRRHETS